MNNTSVLCIHWDDFATKYYAIPIRKIDDQWMSLMFTADNSDASKIKTVSSWLVFHNETDNLEQMTILLTENHMRKAIKTLFSI
jgi:hypothetical protein